MLLIAVVYKVLIGRENDCGAGDSSMVVAILHHHFRRQRQVLYCHADLVGSLEHVSDLRLLRQDHGGQSEVYLGGGGSRFGRLIAVINLGHYRFQG